MTNGPKHTGPHPHKYSTRTTYRYRGNQGPIAVDIDEYVAPSLAKKLLPPTGAVMIRHNGSTPEDRSKTVTHQVYLNALKAAEKVDNEWLARTPEMSGYVRDLIPDEFGVENPPPPLPPEKRWAVKVTAFRNPETGRSMIRIREAVVRPLNTAATRGEK